MGVRARTARAGSDAGEGAHRRVRKQSGGRARPRGKARAASRAQPSHHACRHGCEVPARANVQRLGEPNDRQGGWIASDPFVPHPKPTMTRHDLLRGLHRGLDAAHVPQIGVNEGASLTCRGRNRLRWTRISGSVTRCTVTWTW